MANEIEKRENSLIIGDGTLDKVSIISWSHGLDINGVAIHKDAAEEIIYFLADKFGIPLNQL
jgi:hypothetical protein